MTASQEHAVVCSVLVEAWAPNSGKDHLSYFEWCLIALLPPVFFGHLVVWVWSGSEGQGTTPNTR